ncbi:MAG TPA: DUF302 domain-containing protein [Mycobacterium sp.]|nr:DUF302 domain-containing protein [Mycobacterium sp.]
MSIPDPRETRFDGVRIRVDSDNTYDQAVAALLSEIGEHPEPITDLPAVFFEDWGSFATEITHHLGSSEFMLMHLIDHGQWLATAGINRKALRAVLGNPLIAITMLQHDLTAGLFAPVELLILEEDDNRSSLTYIRPSSLMVIEDNPPLRAAALVLDEKLAALAARVAVGKSTSVESA